MNMLPNLRVGLLVPLSAAEHPIVPHAGLDVLGLEVTSHDKPIACIIGIPAHAEPGLRRLITSGAVSWRGGKPRHESPVQMTARGTSVSQMVLEDRR